MDKVNSKFVNLRSESQERIIKRNKQIKADIESIDVALELDDELKLRQTHLMIDGKYNSYVPNLGASTYGYINQFGYNYELLNKESIRHNLTLFKAKLQGYMYNCDVGHYNAPLTNSVNVNVSNTNEFVVNISFEEARKKIEDMPGLDDASTEEIKEKINELEQIANEGITKKKKWEKVKPILSFALDKGADVAITIMGLILQMKLGM